MITCTRHHDISCGHRVVGGGKCERLHGHNYRVHFTCEAKSLDRAGMVVDFSFMKTEFCETLELMWDHQMLIYEDDPIRELLPHTEIVIVPFNPTAENMAERLLTMEWDLPKGVRLVRVVVEETRKCRAEASK